MSLSPEQRDELRRLLTDELRAAVRAATDRGTGPAGVAGLLDERRRAVETVAAGARSRDDVASLPRDDPQHRLDDPIPGGGVTEQR